MSWRALRLAREERGPGVRLQAFRVARPDVIIGDAGFGVWQARIPEPDGERIISGTRSLSCWSKLDKLTGEGTASGSVDSAPDPVSVWTTGNIGVSSAASGNVRHVFLQRSSEQRVLGHSTPFLYYFRLFRIPLGRTPWARQRRYVNAKVFDGTRVGAGLDFGPVR